MLPLSNTFSFYKRVQDNNLTGRAEQWGSLTTCDQYRIPYQKAAQYVEPGFKCLDWGCGNGHFSYFLTQNGLHTEAYSFQQPPDFLISNPLFHHTPGTSADPVRLPYANETFDAVFSIGVLEHVHEAGGDQQKSILELQRVMKKNGILIIVHLPNKYTWIEFLVRGLNQMRQGAKHQHTRLFTKESMLQLVEGTSLDMLENGRYNFLPRNSFNHLPGNLSNQKMFCNLVHALDTTLATLCPALCQNWYFILRKRPA